MRESLIQRLIRQQYLHPAHLAKAGRIWREGFPASFCVDYLERASGHALTYDQVYLYLKKRWPRAQAGKQIVQFDGFARVGDGAPDRMIRAMAARSWPYAVIAATLNRRWPSLHVASATIKRYIRRHQIPYTAHGPGGDWRYAEGDGLYRRWRPRVSRRGRRRQTVAGM